jgi:hypothetical protein
MNLPTKIVLGVVGVVVLWFAYVNVFGSDEIEYRGTKIKLTRKYVDYDAYKNDEDNIAAFELPRIERMIVETRISATFKDWAAFVQEVFELKVPGYGFGGGPMVKAKGRKLIVSSVEIPTRPWGGKHRYFVLEELPDKSLKVIDDFVSTGFPFLAELELREQRLIYRSKDKTVVRETKL